MSKARVKTAVADHPVLQTRDQVVEAIAAIGRYAPASER